MAAGVMGTPTYFINGKRYNGPFEADVLKPILASGTESRSVIWRTVGASSAGELSVRLWCQKG
jgi:hypothetical protein